jgi:hypothetical protein
VCYVFYALCLLLTTRRPSDWLQVKILRDSERPDPSGNPGGKSRGFGFVEFADHSHALAGEGRLLLLVVAVVVVVAAGGRGEAALLGAVGLSQPHTHRQVRD